MMLFSDGSWRLLLRVTFNNVTGSLDSSYFFEELLFLGVVTNGSCFEVVAVLQSKIEVRKGSGSAFFRRRDLMDVTLKSELVYVVSQNCN